jgi:hypothetical protein
MTLVSQPLCIDLYAGLGGWTAGFLAEGYNVIGFDIEQHVYGEHRYPAQLVVQDVMTLHGSQFREAACLVASPPCQEFSYMAMPWSRAKQIARALRGQGDFPDRYTGSRTTAELTALFDACFRIQREACAAAARYIPLVVENVCGAQPWVGPAKWHHGSFYLWGDVPALMPTTAKAVKVATMGAGWYPPGHPKHVPGLGFNTHAERASKNGGGSRFNVAHNTTSGHGQNPVHDGVKQGGGWFGDATEHALRRHSSKSTARKAASARIAKIPPPLARWIAQCYRPLECATLTERAS